MSQSDVIDLDAPSVIFSSDSHLGPRLVEDLREYCPQKHLAAYDEMVAQHQASIDAVLTMAEEHGISGGVDVRKLITEPPNGPECHYDPHVRLADMDSDGIAAEVAYHFSQNTQQLPWLGGEALGTPGPELFEKAAVGYSIYNRWLAEFCSADPERLLGLLYLPYWDLDACIKEMEQGRARGLRCANFPGVDRPGLEPYNNLSWEPFWDACEDLGISLHSHAGAGGSPSTNYWTGPGGTRILMFESTGVMARRAVWWLVLGEVFARHPKLRLFMTEQSEGWYSNISNEMDSMYLTLFRGMDTELPRLPSEYMHDNVFFGASFVSTGDVQAASRDSWADNLVWGRDFPHIEGTFLRLDDPNAEPITKLSLRHHFSSVPPADAAKMMGLNGVRALGLDEPYLKRVAAKIGALSLRDLAPLGTVPEMTSFAFIGYGGARPVEPERVAWSDWVRAGRTA